MKKLLPKLKASKSIDINPWKKDREKFEISMKEDNIQEISDATKSSYINKASDRNVNDTLDLMKKSPTMSDTSFSGEKSRILKRDNTIRKVISKLGSGIKECSCEAKPKKRLPRK